MALGDMADLKSINFDFHGIFVIGVFRFSHQESFDVDFNRVFSFSSRNSVESYLIMGFPNYFENATTFADKIFFVFFPLSKTKQVLPP